MLGESNGKQVAVMDFSDLNWMAVVAAAVSSFVLGGLWYGPIFGKAWQQQLGLSDEKIAASNPAFIFGLAFVLTLVVATALAALLNVLMPEANVVAGLLIGVEISMVFVVSAFGINYLFARHSMALFGIDAGYMVLMFALMGAILGY
jgi:hypothetical protein